MIPESGPDGEREKKHGARRENDEKEFEGGADRRLHRPHPGLAGEVELGSAGSGRAPPF